jgi:DNA-binding SARP family transcriptional activator
MLHLRTLGDLEIYGDDDLNVPLLRGVKPLLIPAILATLPNRTGSREHLSRLIWDGAEPDHAKASLRQALHHLNRYAKGGGVKAENGALRLDPGAISVDLLEFQGAIKGGNLTQAISVYRGGFLESVGRLAGRELTNWIESEDIKVSSALSATYAELVGTCLRDGAIQDALRHAQTFARMNPLSEKAQLTLIRTLRAVGDDLAALQTYEAYQSLVMSELGGDLGADGHEVLERLRQEAIREPDPATVIYVARAAEKDPRHYRFSKRLVWVAAGSALTLGFVGLASQLSQPRVEPQEPVRLGVVLADSTWAELLVGPSEAEIRAEDPPFLGDARTAIVSPDRAKMVLMLPGPTGRNLAIFDRLSGEQRLVVEGPTDDQPLVWSPDSRFVLYKSGHVTPDRERFTLRLMVLDVANGRSTPFGDLEFTSARGDAAWSPSGLLIALQGFTETGPNELLIYTTDGTEVHRILTGLEVVGQPTWSPDGRHLLFRGGTPESSDLWIVEVPEGAPVRVPVAAPDGGTPFWISDVLVGFSVQTPLGLQLMTHDLTTRVTQQLDSPPGIERLNPIETTLPGVGWIDSLSIRNAPELVSPGQHLGLSVDLLSLDGSVAAANDIPIRWTTTHPDRALVKNGRLEILSTGEFEITAEIGNWRRTSLSMESVPMLEADIPLVFDGNWTGDPLDRRWDPFGDPLPTSKATGGPDGTASMSTNGDSSWESGVVLATGFEWSHGLTLEVEGKAPFTGQHWQSFDVGLTTALPPADSTRATWSGGDYGIWFSLHGYLEATVPYGFNVGVDIPLPPDTEVWHRYALQLSATGIVSIIVDGRLHATAPWDRGVASGTILHPLLAGATVNTDIRFGRVRVWRGERYVLSGSH